MNPKSLLIIFSNPPIIRTQNFLFEDNAQTQIDGVPVFAGVAPWNKMHDLLIDSETRTLAGIVYPVAEQEQAAVAAVCQSLPSQFVRYCISTVQAVSELANSQFQPLEKLNETTDAGSPIEQFPAVMRPYRQAIRICMFGQIEPDELPSEVRAAAASYFEKAGAVQLNGDTARIEVSWINKPVNDKLPSYFPSAFDIELAQYFAEDIWFYRQDNNQIFGVGINYLDKTLADYDLQLPENLREVTA